MSVVSGYYFGIREGDARKGRCTAGSWVLMSGARSMISTHNNRSLVAMARHQLETQLSGEFDIIEW